jgi:uncharacterized membrane protein YccC
VSMLCYWIPTIHNAAFFAPLCCCFIRYRTAFDSLRELRSSLDPAVDSLAAAKEALLAGFDAWLTTQHGQQLGATQQVRWLCCLGQGHLVVSWCCVNRRGHTITLCTHS